MKYCTQCKEWSSAQPHTCFRSLYEPEDGTLTFLDSFVTAQIEVRARLEEQALEHAVVEELRRKGYTVIEP